MSVRLEQVIIANNATRGTGRDGSPVRQITQVYTTDGELLGEFDPDGRYTVERLCELAAYVLKYVDINGGQSVFAAAPIVHKWLEDNRNY